MEQQLISIIVACYNVEKYLNRCVESLVKQTYSNIEIILVDDGSKDKTGSICDKWVTMDSRIKVLHKENGGLSDARNAGIRASHGQWIGIIDGDDYVLPTMYADLFAHRVKSGMTVCGFIIEENGKRTFCPAIDATLSPKEATNLYIENEMHCHCHNCFTYLGSYAWNKLYDRSLFDTVSYPKGKKYEDMYIILDLIWISKKIQFISSCEYIYVQNPQSITHKGSIIHESLQARKNQKLQLLRYWGIFDQRMDRLIACEYFLVLYRYSILSDNERVQCKYVAEWAWEKLQKIGYSYFPLKMKLKLYSYKFFPGLLGNLKKFIIKGKRNDKSKKTAD